MTTQTHWRRVDIKVFRNFFLAIIAAIPVFASSNLIALENEKTGTADWKDGHYDATFIGGFASAISASVTENRQIAFYVSSKSKQYTVDVYRMGWYSGAGARLIATSNLISSISQPACLQDVGSRMVDCSNWSPQYGITIASGWTTGVYLAKFSDPVTGNFSSVPFVVRDDRNSAPLLIQIPFTTYQAYNLYGGADLYAGGASLSYADRSYSVSFDRPYLLPWFTCTPELQLVQFLEREGISVDYSTSIDTHTRPSDLLAHKGWITAGHDEYWSRPMFNAVEAARDAGVNLSFLGGNDAFWQIRFANSSIGANRVIVCYKDVTLDPVAAQDPANATVNFREPPLNRPENQLIGIMSPWGEDRGVDNPNGLSSWSPFNTSHWLFEGTGLSESSAIPTMVGYEWDAPAGNGFTPEGLVLVGLSPACDFNTCGPYATSSLYQAPSGAWVFAGGSIRWSVGLAQSLGVQKLGRNLMKLMTGTLTTAPYVADAVNAADQRSPNTVAPGEIVTIVGQNIGPDVPSVSKRNSSGQLPTAVAGTSVLVNNQAVPILYAERNHITAELPWTISGDNGTLAVENAGKSSNLIGFAVNQAMPAVFTTPVAGTGQGAVLNQNLSVNSATNPATAGSNIQTYVTGAGLTSPLPLDGALYGSKRATLVLPATATIDGVPATVEYAGSASGLAAGIVQVTVRLPATLATGLHHLVLEVDGQQSQTVNVQVK